MLDNIKNVTLAEGHVLLSVKMMDGRIYSFDVVPTKDTVETVKNLIEAGQGFPKHRQRLFFLNKNMENQKKISSFNLKPDSVLILWVGVEIQRDEDHSEATNALLEKINATSLPVLLRSQSDKTLEDFVRELLSFEKVCRLGGDSLSAKKLAVEALRLYKSQKKVDGMLQCMDELMRRRAQSKIVQSALVAECTLLLSDTSLVAPDHRVEVLSNLAHVTDGKIHVELEHARFVIELASIAEKEGRRKEANSMLAGLQVETITNMPRLEKLHVICKQIHLCLETSDYELIPPISRKVNYRALARSEARDAKLEYFALMFKYYEHRESFFNAARCWYEIFMTPSASACSVTTGKDPFAVAEDATEEDLLNDSQRDMNALSNLLVMYLIGEYSTPKEIDNLAEFTAFHPTTFFADRTAALKGLLTHKNFHLEDNAPALYQLVKWFNSVEIIHTKISPLIFTLMEAHELLRQNARYQDLLRSRGSEHDLMVVSTRYSRIKLDRLSQIVNLSPQHTEQFMMEMVSNKALYAKMDRVDGLVVFEPPKDATSVMDSWSKRVDRCVELVDKASHLIVKERMIHNLPVAGTA